MNKPFQSSPGHLYQNEVKCSAFDMELNFHSCANKTHLHKKDCALGAHGLILKVTALGTRKLPIDSFISLERRRRLGRGNFCKDNWVCC